MQANRLLPIRWICMLCAAAAMSGCATFDALTYKNSEFSAQPKGTFEFVLVAPGTKRGEVTDKHPAFKADEDLLRQFDSSCVKHAEAGPTVMMLPVLVPVVAAAVQLGFESLVASQERKVESIVNAAKVNYSATVTVSPGSLGALTTGGCVLALRYTTTEDNTPEKKKTIVPQLSVLLSLTGHPTGSNTNTGAITFKPEYVRAKSSVAGTRETAKPTVSFSFALSAKAITRDGQSAIRRLTGVGEAVSTVSDVGIGPASKGQCPDGCPDSDLMAFPVDAGTLSLSLAVAEQGTTGFDDKAASAELAAIKAAIGPALSEAVKAKYAP